MELLRQLELLAIVKSVDLSSVTIERSSVWATEKVRKAQQEDSNIGPLPQWICNKRPRLVRKGVSESSTLKP